MTQEDILDGRSNLRVLPRSGTVTDAQLADSRETYRIARFARKWTVDEQDMIDDRLGDHADASGDGQRLLDRPDLVYSLLLSNPELADGGALFNNTAVTTPAATRT